MNYIDIFKKGGIHIKKENRGKFTKSAKAAGEGVQEHAHKVMNDPNATPLQKRRANFAIQAKKWKHEEGGKSKRVKNPSADPAGSSNNDQLEQGPGGSVKNPLVGNSGIDTSAPLPRNLFDNTPLVQQEVAGNNDFDWEGIKELENNPTVSEGLTSSSIDTIIESIPDIDNKDIPRAVRYNNPGMMRPGDNWEGMLGIIDNYIVFKSPEYGYRAMSKDLVNKIKRGVNTIRSIVTAWAPESDNNPTSNYIAKVSELTGINPDEKIQETDKKKLLQIIAAMSQFESGKPANWDHIDAGWGLAFGND